MELRQEIAHKIHSEPFWVDGSIYWAEKLADTILALPEIAAGLKLLKESIPEGRTCNGCKFDYRRMWDCEWGCQLIPDRITWGIKQDECPKSKVKGETHV